MYNRYAESARVQFIRHHGLDATAEERKQWEDLVTPRSLGLILKTMTTEFKFVRQASHSPLCLPWRDSLTMGYYLLRPFSR